VVRARGALLTAASEGSAKRDLSRFFGSYVAEHIIGSDHELNPGEGQLREAAVVFFDKRGFTGMSGPSTLRGWCVCYRIISRGLSRSFRPTMV